MDRPNDDERRARMKALVQQAHELRARAEAARREAQTILAHSSKLLSHVEPRTPRDTSVSTATDALDQVSTTSSSAVVLPFPIDRRKKSA